MAAKVRLSVAMCTYNGARFLEQQLASIASQSRLPEEVVICDDCSTDNTVALIECWQRSLPFRVKIKQNERRLGVAKNFERAVTLCDGEIIVFADQDDVWMPNKLAVLERVLTEHPSAGYVFSDARLIDERGTDVGKNLWAQIGFHAGKRRLFRENHVNQVRELLKRNFVTGATMAVRTRLAWQALPIPTGWLHDAWFALALSVHGAPGLLVEEPLTLYRQHQGQVIGVRVRRGGWLGLLGRIALAVRDNCQAYHVEVTNWTGAWRQLRSLAGDDEVVARLLDGKIQHLLHRVRIQRRSRVARLPGIVVELLAGRYALFSNGWRAAVRDILVAGGA